MTGLRSDHLPDNIATSDSFSWSVGLESRWDYEGIQTSCLRSGQGLIDSVVDGLPGEAVANLIL